MFCFHKFGKVEDGYQYCTKCGKAILVPCNHNWETLSMRDLFRTTDGVKSLIGTMYQLRCTKCGQISQKNAGIC